MTYHASYEQAHEMGGVRKFTLRIHTGWIWIESVGVIDEERGQVHGLDPTAARWLANRLIEAAEEMQKI